MTTRNLWPLACMLLGLATTSAQTNLALLVGSPGDYIASGTYVTTNQADIGISGTPSTLTFTAFGFSIFFPGPNGMALTVGTYTNAGLRVFGDGRACNRACGEFQIFELHTDTDGNVDRFWATFTQVCECAFPPLRGEIRYNSQLAPPPPPPRTLRVPSQFATIQSALDAANLVTSDTILVDPGVYAENLWFKGRSAQVISTGGPDVTFIAPPASSPGVQFISGETRQALLSGFTISNCNRAIDVRASSPTIVSNVIRNCGNGLTCYYASPLILSNAFTGCGDDGIHIEGAGSATVVGNLIRSNHVGISILWLGNPSIYNNVIQSNQFRGMVISDYPDAHIYQNIISENGSDGVYCAVAHGSPRIINNTICNNGTLGSGGAGFWSDGSPASVLIANNIISGNPALNVNPNYSSEWPMIQFNDIFSPTGKAYSGAITNPIAFPHNFSADPGFACPINNDFHLLPGSPCVDAGDNSVLSNFPPFDFDGRNRVIAGSSAIVDMGAFELDPAAAIPPCVYITCPTNMTASATNENGVTVNFPTPIAPPGANVICSPPSGTIFLPGTNVVFCTANLGSVTDTCAFTITVVVHPPNDLVENATVISSFPFEDHQDMSSATRSEGDSLCITDGGTVWYKFRSKKNQLITVSTDRSDFDARLTVCQLPRKGAAQLIACDLDSINFNALPGHTYYIMAGQYYSPYGKQQLHFTATSQPILRVHATIARTATIGPGWSEYHGTVTSTRPTVIDISGTVWMYVGGRNIQVDSFSNSVWCGGKSATWDIEGYPMANFTGGTVRVNLSYTAHEALNSSSGHSTTEVNLRPVGDWPLAR